MATGSGPMLLLADDLMMTSRIREGAKSAGYALVTAGTLEAVQRAVTADPAPSAILVALNTRRADPFAAIRSLKSDPATAAIPILAFAGHVEREKHLAAREAGADLVAANSSVSLHLAPLLTRLLGGERGLATEEE